MTRTDRIAALQAAAKERILILDGSWGVMIQRRSWPRPTSAASASPTTTAS